MAASLLWEKPEISVSWVLKLAVRHVSDVKFSELEKGKLKVAKEWHIKSEN